MQRILFHTIITCAFVACSKSSKLVQSSQENDSDSKAQKITHRNNGCTKIQIQPTCSHAPMHQTHLYEDDFVIREINANELEIKLIDNWTKGAFRKALVRTAERLAGQPIECAEDVREIDALSPPALSNMERDARNNVYAVALAFYYAEHSGNPDVLSEKIRNYRKIFAHLAQSPPLRE